MDTDAECFFRTTLKIGHYELCVLALFPSLCHVYRSKSIPLNPFTVLSKRCSMVVMVLARGGSQEPLAVHVYVCYHYVSDGSGCLGT